MMYYICPTCGAALDLGEKCEDCAKEIRRPDAVTSDAARTKSTITNNITDLLSEIKKELEYDRIR